MLSQSTGRPKRLPEHATSDVAAFRNNPTGKNAFFSQLKETSEKPYEAIFDFFKKLVTRRILRFFFLSPSTQVCLNSILLSCQPDSI